MNNTEMNFDPMTGQPLNNTTPVPQNVPNNEVVQQPTITQTDIQSHQQPVTIPTPTIDQPTNQQDNLVTQQAQMQTIPTVDQSRQDFINNTQAQNVEKKEDKKSDINYTFIIILFVIIFAAIFFLFPFLLKYI